MTTDTSERGLERLICEALTGDPCHPSAGRTVGERPAPYGGVGWSPGNHHDYNPEYCVDLIQLRTFLHATQPDSAPALRLDEDGPTRRKFVARLQDEISKRGTIDVLRDGIKHGPHDLDLFYGTPSAQNETAQRRFLQNQFSVTRQLRYSRDDTQRSLDIGLFINGLPVFTFELKNRLTKQTFNDAILQYSRDRNPREPLFQFGRCVAHFAVDENEVHFCTHLRGKASWFLPFNRGWQRGAGNPAQPARPQVRIPVARGARSGERGQHPRELRAGGAVEEREDRQDEEGPDLAEIPAARCGAPAPGGRPRARDGEAVPDPAFGWQRQELFDRLAGPSARPATEGR